MKKGFEKHIKDSEPKKIKTSKRFLYPENNIKINKNIAPLDSIGYTKVRTDRQIFSVIKSDEINPFPSIYSHIKKLKGKNWYYRTDIGNN